MDITYYDHQWKNVDSLMNKGLNQSALEQITKIYDYAMANNNYAQALKAIVYRFDNQIIVNDNNQAVINLLRQDIKSLPQPAKSAGYALIANIYGDYYKHNWRIRERTRSAVTSDDIETWDMTRFFEEALKYHRLSIKSETVLQQTPLGDYLPIVNYSEDTTLLHVILPTLYDLLVFNAIEAYRDERSVALPQQAFILDKPEYLADVNTFVNYRIETPDSLSAEYNVLCLYQKLLKFRLQDENNSAALVSLDVKRLEYVYNNGKYNDRDALYENALKSLMETYCQRNEWTYPAFALATIYNKQGCDESKNSRFRYRLKEAHDLCTEIISCYKEKDEVQIIVKSATLLLKNIEQPSMKVTVKQLQYPNSPILALAEYKNTDCLYLKIYKADDETLFKRNVFNDFKNKKTVAAKKIVLPLYDDYQKHSTEIMIDGLPQGIYVICADDSTKINKDAVVFQVSPLNVAMCRHIENSGSKTQVYVANAKTGEPIKNAKIECFFDKNKTDSKTDNNGMAYISNMKTNPRIIKMVVSSGNQRLVINEFGYHNLYYAPSSVKEKKTMEFFTDRSVYRPGQTVYYKALYLEQIDGKYNLLQNENIEVNLQDVNWKIIATQQHLTNEYGSIQGSFTIPQGLLNGTMRLSSKYGEQSILVEEYKRPTFEIKFDTITKNYRPDDNVQLTGKVEAFSGYAVDNAKLEYHIVRNVEYRTYRWWLPHLDMYDEIASGTLNTDEKGKFMIEFQAKSGNIADDNLIYSYDVTVSVTDINGETQSAEKSIHIGTKPLLVKTKIPERIIDRNSLMFDIQTTNLDRNFTPADLQVTVTALKSPDRVLHSRLWAYPDTCIMSRENLKKYFPIDPYGDEDIPEKYQKIKQIDLYTMKTVSARDKINLQSLADAPAGWYRIDVKAKNAEGIEVEHYECFQLLGNRVAKSSETIVPSPITNMSNWLTVLKSSCEPDDNVEFWAGGCEKQSYIHYNIVHKKRIVGRKSIVATVPERIVIPVKEEYRGGFAVQFLMMQNGRIYTETVQIDVPYTNKQLDIRFITFRDKLLPGEKDKWTLAIKNKKGDKETAEMVATLYDASLDVFRPHSWDKGFYPKENFLYKWESFCHEIDDFGFSGRLHYFGNDEIFAYPHLIAPNLDSPVKRTRFMTSYRTMAKNEMLIDDMDIPQFGAGIVEEQVVSDKQSSVHQVSLTDIATRQNFNETAFFYPQLRTDENGEISIEFTIPEALTRWKMLGFAHTPDFKTGYLDNELVTQKQVAISVNVPRFLRENDTIELTAKVNNVSGDDLTGQALLRLYDAVTMQPVDDKIMRSQPTLSFDLKTGLSAVLKWTLVIPENMQAISYKVTAQAGSHTDGEEKIIPVLKNSVLVTETMPFNVRAGEQKNLTFYNLRNSKSSTLRNHRLTLEFTSNPAWYAVQAMPYLMEYPYECSEQTFSRFYANSLSATVVNSSPRVRQIFDMWRNLPEFKDALLSNIEKNQELKQVLLEETPWVVQAQNETERKKRIGLLFDLNRMSAEQQRAFDKVKKAQREDGGFPWFAGCPSSYFITSHIISGFEHLDRLNALGDFKDEVRDLINRGLLFMDNEIQENYEKLSKHSLSMNDPHIGHPEIKYLYTCSFSGYKPKDTKAFDYYFAQARQYWTKFNLYAQAMIALSMHRFGDDRTAMEIIRSLKERSQQSDEMGMFWKNNVAGYFWYQATIETQALLIEAFNEVANDKRSVDEMKIWLLRNKQTNDWRTTKATAEACYALLMTGANLLDENKTLEFTIGGKPLSKAVQKEIRSEAGTGYVKTAWSGAGIKRNMATITVANPNSNGIAWGGMYWQYFEQLDKVVGAETSLKMEKQLFLKTVTIRGMELVPLDEDNILKTGDILTVRMILRADRDYEFVHLKDMRAANLEPTKFTSGHRYQDGLWYYESIKDASTNFFITYLGKGTYVFEYDLRVTHAGQFSNGFTTFQCMYAPEFSSHSAGIRIKVK